MVHSHIFLVEIQIGIAYFKNNLAILTKNIFSIPFDLENIFQEFYPKKHILDVHREFHK